MVKVEWNLGIYKKKVRKLILFCLKMWKDKVNTIELFKTLKGIVKIDKILFLYAILIIQEGEITQN